MHEVLVKRLGRLSLPRKSIVRLTDCPDMTIDVYRGRKTAMQQQQLLGCLQERDREREAEGESMSHFNGLGALKAVLIKGTNYVQVLNWTCHLQLYSYACDQVTINSVGSC